MKPIIGITMDGRRDPGDERAGGKLMLNWNYAEVISEFGGAPLLLPPTTDPAAIEGILDGLMIPGGDDIHPRHYGQELHPETDLISEARYDFERRLFEVIPSNLPVLGICYGCQFINVMHGGSLIQHLPDRVGHDHDRGGTVQRYRIEPGTQTGQLIGSSATGQSWHHQSIDTVGEHLRVTAYNEDGTIEGIEGAKRAWMIGVQWHPERTVEDPNSERLFEAFIEAARSYRMARAA